MNVLEVGALSSSVTDAQNSRQAQTPTGQSRARPKHSHKSKMFSQRKTFSQTMLHSQNILKTNPGLIFTQKNINNLRSEVL